MVTFQVEDVHNISVDKFTWNTMIDISDIRGSTVRIAMSTDDAEILTERLYEVLKKDRG